MRAGYIKYTLLFIVLLSVIKTQATHIVGGELNYKNLGSNNYEIRLTVYRDCWVGVPPFDDPASVGVFNSSHQLLQVLEMTFRGLDTLPPEINDPCVIPPTDFCYEVTTYIDTINLPPLAGGYQISYQRCCRNQNILNIINPTCTGATYYAFIPGPETVVVNSNPVFKKWPPPFICQNKPWVFDHSALDYDGDSLVYELFQPYEGLNGQCPIIGNYMPTGINCPNSYTLCPNVPVNPPFASIIWQPPYSTNDMLGGIPMQVNPSTGLVTATPNLQGYFVIGVKVKEYRNGILISETKRDFQLIVKPCPSQVVAAAAAPSLVCGLNTPVEFTNNSSGSSAIGYNWNFGDTSTLVDTSHATTPNYTYPSTGSYTATLTSYILNKPGCRDSVNIPVLVDHETIASFFSVTDTCSNKILFNNQSTPNPSNAFWFINGVQTSTLQTFNYSFLSSGNYTIKLIAQTPLGCKDTLQQTVIVPVDSVSINPNKVKCINQSVQLLATGGGTYSWQPTSALNNTIVSNPISTATANTVYSVTITQQSLFGKTCARTLTTQVSVNPIDSAKFIIASYPCTDSVRLLNTSPNTSTTQAYTWNLGILPLISNTSPLVQHYSTNGTYNVSLFTVNAFGCRDSVVKPVTIFNFTTSVFSGDTICRGFTSQLSASGGTGYTWSPAGSLSDPTIQNPVSNPSTTTSYNVIIENNSILSCKDTLSVLVVVNPKINANFTYSIGACANDVQFVDSSFVAPVNWQWNFGDSNTSSQQQSIHYYGVSNIYTVNLISTNQYGCKDTAQKVIYLPPFDPISVNNTVVKCAEDTVQLFASGGLKYQWIPSQYLSDPAIANPLAFPPVNTTYSVIISSLKGTDTCSSILSTQVVLYPFTYNPALINLSQDTIVLGETVIVTLPGFPTSNSVVVTPQTNVQYVSNGIIHIAPTKSGEYTVYATDPGGCIHELKRFYVLVETDNCNESVVFLPTGFTPNNDGVNDVLYIRSNFITDVFLIIYNRWGERLFETDDLNVGWDGTFKGKQLDQGVYGYYMTFTCNNGEKSFKKGNITLLR